MELIMPRMKDIPKVDQPREKALLYGLNCLSNAELLALTISFGTKNNSALDVAYELLSHFDGILGITKASIKDISSIKGIDKVKALKLKAAFLLYERAVKEQTENDVKLKGRDEIANFFRLKLADNVQERAYIVIVNSHNKAIFIKELFRGTSHKLTISPRLIIKEVIDKGSRFYVIHNHPSNICEPSVEDRKATSEIEFLSYSFGVVLVDHLIITKDSYYSLIDNKEYNYL